MATQTRTATLRQKYDDLKAAQPKLRIRNAARQLGVAELELLELGLGDQVVRLNGACHDILLDVESLGYVMALTRNENAVHERKGVYHNVSFMAEGKMGVAVNPDIDLRLFMTRWTYAYAAQVQAGPNRTLSSLQFFDAQGEAVHKIYATPKTDRDAWDRLVEKFRDPDQERVTVPAPPEEKKPPARLPDNFDAEAFQRDWLDLKDTHDFFSLLRQHEISRTDAMRQAPAGHTRRLADRALTDMLNLASEREVPIMVFVGNKGCIQIHSGPVKRILPMNGWINVLDPIFNLHVKEAGIAEIWETRKPTTDGIVTGLEVFDHDGQLLVYCFGKRKPGIPELETWRDLVADLPSYPRPST